MEEKEGHIMKVIFYKADFLTTNTVKIMSKWSKRVFIKSLF